MKKRIKMGLSAMVLIMAVILNVDYSRRHTLNDVLTLSYYMKMTTCHAEELRGKDDNTGGERPILYSPCNPDKQLTEEEIKRLLWLQSMQKE